MIRALDASSYQGAPNWGAVKADGVELVILKASESTRDSLSFWFHQEAPKALAAGLQVASYHFAYTPGDPAAQAAWFVSQTAILPTDTVTLSNGAHLPSRWLDMESGAGDLTGWARTFLKGTGKPTGFYSYSPFITSHIQKGAADLGAYRLWLASYQGTCPLPPAPWSAVSLWQNTSSASQPGILGRTDSDFVLAQPQGRRPMYVTAHVPAPDANGTQSFNVDGVPFDSVLSAVIVAAGNAKPIPAIVQIVKNPFMGNVILTFASLVPGQPVAPGDIGVVLGVAS
jgi:GH25 family lysozyme M1 (1,4-beta-N-acetylmuramidase)